MIARIQNKIGMSVDIPHYDEKAYRYCDFYLNFADQVVCQNIAGKKVIVAPPYTVIKRFLGTDHKITESRKEVL